MRNLMYNLIEQGLCFLDLHQSLLHKLTRQLISVYVDRSFREYEPLRIEVTQHNGRLRYSTDETVQMKPLLAQTNLRWNLRVHTTFAKSEFVNLWQPVVKLFQLFAILWCSALSVCFFSWSREFELLHTVSSVSSDSQMGAMGPGYYFSTLIGHDSCISATDQPCAYGFLTDYPPQFSFLFSLLFSHLIFVPHFRFSFLLSLTAHSRSLLIRQIFAELICFRLQDEAFIHAFRTRSYYRISGLHCDCFEKRQLLVSR